MVKLPDIWKTVSGLGTPAANGTVSTSLLTDADLDLDNGDFSPDDPDIPDFIRDRLRERQHDKQVAAEFDHRQQQVAEARKEQGEGGSHIREWLASAKYQQAIQELSEDLDDARTVARGSYARAVKREKEAEESLEDARRHAIILADGRHVYFTKDGRHLFGEDDREVTDRSALADAETQHASNPNATTYEEYTRRRQDRNRAAETSERLHSILDRLDALEEKVKAGNLSPEQLAEAQKEKQDIIDAMPADAREEYDRLKAARKNEQSLSYRAVDPAFSSAPAVCKDFCEAGAPSAQPVNEEPKPEISRSAPAYKSAPDYSSPQG